MSSRFDLALTTPLLLPAGFAFFCFAPMFPTFISYFFPALVTSRISGSCSSASCPSAVAWAGICTLCTDARSLTLATQV